MPKSVISAHNWGWVFVQATVAILILVGFESVTAMGGEAKNAKRDIPIAVILSLLVQGLFCYLFEYFAANYFLNSGYTMQSASSSAAPIGDMMIVVGDALFGPGNGRIFMLMRSLHGVPGAHRNHALLHEHRRARNLCHGQGRGSARALRHAALEEPHARIVPSGRWRSSRRWSAASQSSMVFGDAGAPTDAAIKALPQGFWSSFGYTTHDKMAALPNSLLTVTLASNFGTFLLYRLSCIICIVAYHGHPKFNLVRHLFIPVFGLLANLACMIFYVIGPFMGYGTKKEPLLALGIALVWAFTAASTSCVPAKPRDVPPWWSEAESSPSSEPLSEVIHEGGFRPALYLA